MTAVLTAAVTDPSSALDLNLQREKLTAPNNVEGMPGMYSLGGFWVFFPPQKTH